MKELVLAYALLTMQPALPLDGELVQCGPYGEFRCGPPPGPGGYPGEYRQPYRYYSPDLPLMYPGQYPPVRQGPQFNPRYRSRPEFYPGPPPGYPRY